MSVLATVGSQVKCLVELRDVILHRKGLGRCHPQKPNF